MSMSLWRSGHLKIWHKNMWAAIWQDFSPLPMGTLATAGISMHDPGSAPLVFTAFNKVSKCVLFRPFNMIWICFFFAGELRLVISLHLQQYLVWLPIFHNLFLKFWGKSYLQLLQFDIILQFKLYFELFTYYIMIQKTGRQINETVRRDGHDFLFLQLTKKNC